MYLLLLVFGGLLSAAGVVLVGSGVSLRDGAFDATILTPGIVAAAGGLLLIGLGAGLRTLQRIERTLALRPMPRALPITESAKASESVETSREPARIPFAPKAVPESQPTVDLRNKSPEATFPADKISPVVPEIAIAAAHDASAEINAHRTGSNGNGAASTRTGLRLSASLRRPSADERQSERAFDALWPKDPRPSRAIEAAPVPTVQGAGASPIQSQHSAGATNTPAPATYADNTATGVSVLKSGVVNGMPYTLYSDGSIEAQLPEGTLRFGSITELRNHIEQSA